jgi:hypothetical protein
VLGVLGAVIVLAIVVIAILWFFLGVRVIRSDRVGIVEKWWSYTLLTFWLTYGCVVLFPAGWGGG